MEVANLKVEERAAHGTNQVRRLRDTGMIPMVLYGGGKDPVALQAPYHDVKRHLEHHLRVFKLERGSEVQPGYLSDVQWDCLTDEPLHIDFRRIEMDQPLKMDIEIALLGRPKGESSGGRLIRDVQYLHLACLPAHVPEQVEIKIADLEIGDEIRAQDVELPEGCTLDMPGDQVIMHVADEKASAPEEEVAEGEDAPAEPPAEG